jgi:hypothetical protein
MLPFFISLIVACLVHRAWLPQVGTGMVILSAAFSGLTAYGSLDPKVLAVADPSQVNFYVWTAVGLGVAEVLAAFLLVWALRRLFGRRKAKRMAAK